MRQLGLSLIVQSEEEEEEEGPVVRLNQPMQARVVTLMAQSMVALVDPPVAERPAGGDDDQP